MPEDWYLVGFYRRVSEQYVNQTPMGVKDGPPVLTLRLEALDVALRTFGYPEELWGWLIEGAQMLHRLVHSPLRNEEWFRETGKRWGEIRPEDVS